jgi:hypothetical protein
MSAGSQNGRMVRRPPAGRQALQPGSALWPDGGLQALSSPWWEGVAYPCAPHRDRSSAAEPFPAVRHERTGPNFEAAAPEGAVRSIRSLVHRESHRGGKGGALPMARIMAVLTTLAALFLVVGASTKY